MAKEKALIIRRHAHEELEISYEFYVKEYSLDYAEKFRKEFYDEIERIIPNYDSFPECRYLATKTRRYRNIVWGNYLIVYKITSNEIEVLSLFHTKRDPIKLKRLRRIK